jgi:hypothetical protein
MADPVLFVFAGRDTVGDDYILALWRGTTPLLGVAIVFLRHII